MKQLTMEQNNQIDELFKEGLKTEYPYDANLWHQVENQLPKTGFRAWYFNLNSLLILTLSVISCKLLRQVKITLRLK